MTGKLNVKIEFLNDKYFLCFSKPNFKAADKKFSAISVT